MEVGGLVFLALLVFMLFVFANLSFEASSLKTHVIFGGVYPPVDIEAGFLSIQVSSMSLTQSSNHHMGTWERLQMFITSLDYITSLILKVYNTNLRFLPIVSVICESDGYSEMIYLGWESNVCINFKILLVGTSNLGHH